METGRGELCGRARANPFISKNNFELKNAQRVLLEGNILENSWGGFSQTGYSILLTPKNQAPGVCPICKVTDVTLRYNRVIRVAGVLQIANALGGHADENLISAGGGRYSIHDLVAEEIHQQDFKGPGSFVQIGSRFRRCMTSGSRTAPHFLPGVLITIFNPVGRTQDLGMKIEEQHFWSEPKADRGLGRRPGELRVSARQARTGRHREVLLRR